jgi:hypothetical protein
MHESIENMRIFSQLTQGFYKLDTPNGKLGFIGGLIFPYSIATTFILWTVTRDQTYQTLISSQQLELIKTLNMHDKNMPSPRDRSMMIWYLSIKVRDILLEWNGEWFEKAVNEMVRD